MTHDRGIVRPVRGKHAPALGPLAILTATEADFGSLRKRLGLPDTRTLFISRLCYNRERQDDVSLVGPIAGSPYAAMLVETLRAWGVSRFLFYGWCGAIQTSVSAGDIIVVHSAIIDEGTSPHYRRAQGASVDSDAALTTALRRTLDGRDLQFHYGRVWTTDAIFRETPDKVRQFGRRGALAVDMETSAVFSIARFYAMSAAAILVVSDELATLQWRPGFKDPAFKQSRSTICDLLSEQYGTFA